MNERMDGPNVELYNRNLWTVCKQNHSKFRKPYAVAYPFTSLVIRSDKSASNSLQMRRKTLYWYTSPLERLIKCYIPR